MDIMKLKMRCNGNDFKMATEVVKKRLLVYVAAISEC